MQIDGPLPHEFLPQEAERTLNSLKKLTFKSIFMHIHGYFFERIHPASAVEEIKAKEKQRDTATAQITELLH